MLDFTVTFIITIINITILFFVLKAILFKPVTKFMADRAKRVQETIEQAQKDEEAAKKLLAEYEDKLKNVETQVHEILRIAHEDAERQSQTIIADGQRSVQDMTAAALKQIEMEHQAALAKFKLEAAALIIAVCAKLATKDFSGDDNRRYVNMLLDELSAQKGKG
jgi:F0F1-type ATP synthase, subunit b